jgi:hypothetical protein
MQHCIAPNVRHADLTGLWHAAGRHRASVASRRRVLGIAVALLVGLAVVGHVGWLVLTHSSAAARPYPAFTRTQRHSAAAADDWIRANLATGIRLLADGFDPPAGYQPVTLATAGANWRNYSYLVTSTTADPPAGSALATVWKSSTAVARFNDVEVRCILPLIPPEEIRRNHDLDRVERLQAGAALQDNPRLMSSPSAKDILATGQLDLRAAAVLTALVTQVPFALNEIVLVAPEAAAEMPARFITVYSSDPAGFTRALSGVARRWHPIRSPSVRTVPSHCTGHSASRRCLR